MKGYVIDTFFKQSPSKLNGVFGRDTDTFISRLGHLTTLISCERCEAEFLCRRLSFATVHGNAQSLAQAGHPSSRIGVALCYL